MPESAKEPTVREVITERYQLGDDAPMIEPIEAHEYEQSDPEVAACDLCGKPRRSHP